MLRKSRRTVALTGAGISAESGARLIEINPEKAIPDVDLRLPDRAAKAMR